MAAPIPCNLPGRLVRRGEDTLFVCPTGHESKVKVEIEKGGP